MPLGMELGLDPGDIVLDGNPAPLPKKGGRAPIFRPFLLRPAPSPKRAEPSQFLAHIYSGQTAAWIKMPLGIEVGLGLCGIVLDGDTAPPPLKGHSPPIFGQCPLWPNGWMD